MTRQAKRSAAGALRCSIEEPSAKERLARRLNDIVQDRNLSQSEAARVLAMRQPKVSAISNYKLRGISLQRLMRALTALGQHVEIVVSPSGPARRARTTAGTKLPYRSSGPAARAVDINAAFTGTRQ